MGAPTWPPSPQRSAAPRQSRGAPRGDGSLVSPSSRNEKTSVDTILETADGCLLDLVDNLLNKGVVVTGEVMLGLAGIDLVYVRLSALLCAADRVFPDTRKGTRS